MQRGYSAEYESLIVLSNNKSRSDMEYATVRQNCTPTGQTGPTALLLSTGFLYLSSSEVLFPAHLHSPHKIVYERMNGRANTLDKRHVNRISLKSYQTH